jgi:hypothetical protein
MIVKFSLEKKSIFPGRNHGASVAQHKIYFSRKITLISFLKQQQQIVSKKIETEINFSYGTLIIFNDLCDRVLKQKGNATSSCSNQSSSDEQ